MIVLSGLSDTERRAYLLADNKLAEKAGWDRNALAIETRGPWRWSRFGWVGATIGGCRSFSHAALERLLDCEVSPEGPNEKGGRVMIWTLFGIVALACWFLGFCFTIRLIGWRRNKLSSRCLEMAPESAGKVRQQARAVPGAFQQRERR